ncbi:MAG: biotin/lipoyl-containing protein, partial [Nitrososphaerota archaeon]
MTLIQVKLPDMGEGIAEGEIVKWLVREGDIVKKYQPLAEIMTVKVNVEVPSPYGGRVVRLLAKEGDVLPVGQPFIEIETADEVETVQSHVEAPSTPVQRAAPTEKREVQVMATPAVKRLAKELGVELEKVTGTGPGGRILEEDVRRAASRTGEMVSLTRIPLKGLRRIIVEKLVAAKTKTALVTVFESVDSGELIA